jgi:hypothetical protein
VDTKHSDFWWLTPDDTAEYKHVELMHQEPYSDEPGSNRQPLTVPTFHSLDASGNLSPVVKRHSIKFIDEWRSKCSNTNVFRSLKLFSAAHHGDELLGPFLIDIDRQQGRPNKGYVMNLDEALEDTRRLVQRCLCKLREDDYRIFFSGHKGFNIEVRPQALGIVSSDEQQQQFTNMRAHINRAFRSDFVDPIKRHMRLHDSINCWIANNGKKVSRMRFELSLSNLNSLSVGDICERAEKLVSNS